MSKTKMKRLLALGLALVVALGTLAGCNSGDGEEEGDASQQEKTVSQVIEIAALNGPTGMAMAPLVGETDKYNITVYQAPDEVLAKVVKGEVDVAAVPSNVASVLYKKTEGAIQAAAIQTGGILYLMENPEETQDVSGGTSADLASLRGRTIYASGQGGIPEYVLRQLLSNAGLNPDTDVTIQWMSSHSDTASSMMTQPGSVALLPEPFVTTVKAKNDNMKVIFDMNELWKEAYDDTLPMGVLVVQKSFMEERAADWDVLKADMAQAAAWINENPKEASGVIVEAGIGNDAAVMEQAVPNCNICFITGNEMKAALENLYGVLAEIQPAAIGGTMPDEGFYLQ